MVVPCLIIYAVINITAIFSIAVSASRNEPTAESHRVKSDSSKVVPLNQFVFKRDWIEQKAGQKTRARPTLTTR
jgi:hypothetical protein